MSNKKILLLISILCSSFASFGCGIDVSIQEGDTISMCQQNLQSINASNGYVSYSWHGAGTGSSQSLTPSVGGWYYVDATDGVACVSTDSIFVIINADPVPVIQSSEGTNLCPGSTGTNLSLTTGYANYVWSTGETTSTIQVADQANYSVLVTDANGCSATANMQINVIQFNLVTIGGTKVCSYSSVALQASGGDAYSWSTGEFTDLIVVSPNVETTYTVTIFKGACTVTLSQIIGVYDVPDYEFPDTLYYAVTDAKGISAPDGFINYHWSPEEFISDPDAQSTTYSGIESGYAVVTAEIPDGCQMIDSVYIFIIDLTIPEGFSPNNDLINDNFVVPELEFIQAHVYFWNRWGDLVFESENYQNDWNGKCKSTFCVGNEELPEGTYYYLIEIHDVKFEGFITLKR